MAAGCRAGNGEGVNREGGNDCMVCSDIGDSVLVIDDRSEHICTIIGKRREMVSGIRGDGTGRRTDVGNS